MDISRILNSVGLKVTPVRVALMEVLIRSEIPLQQKDIEVSMLEPIDRVTLYRNLKLLTKKNIIHKIEVNDSITTYNIVKANGESIEDEEHPHFHCDTCNKVFCLPGVTINNLTLPSGFEQTSQKLIIDGICKSCNNRK